MYNILHSIGYDKCKGIQKTFPIIIFSNLNTNENVKVESGYLENLISGRFN